MMLPAASVAHALPGRIRIRVPGMRGNRAWFDEAAAALGRLPALASVSASHRTATILVQGRNLEPGLLAQAGHEAGLFDLDDSGVPGNNRAAGARHTLAGAMLLLAVVQTLRGQVMVPAMSFAWYALELMTRDTRDVG